MSGFVLRRITADDVPALVAVHEESWAPYELSVKLGRRYLSLFYREVAASADAFGYLAESGGKVLGYAIGFSNYDAFNHAFARNQRLSLAWILFSRLARLKLSVGDVSNLFRESQKGRKATFMRWHVGALALRNDLKGTALGKEAISDAIDAVMTHLASLGAPGCSAVCDARNMAMRKRFIALGFVEKDEVPMHGRSIVLLERLLGPSVNRAHPVS